MTMWSCWTVICWTATCDYTFPEQSGRSRGIGRLIRAMTRRSTGCPTLSSLRNWSDGSGITPDTTVVAYDGSGSLYAARTWWTFNRFGHTNFKILHGGLDKWYAEGRPLSRQNLRPKAVEYPTPATPHDDSICRLDDIPGALGGRQSRLLGRALGRRVDRRQQARHSTRRTHPRRRPSGVAAHPGEPGAHAQAAGRAARGCSATWASRPTTTVTTY